MFSAWARNVRSNHKVISISLPAEAGITITPTLVSFGGRLPVLCADHRQAHLALLINVGVIDFCLECDLGRLERVLSRENDFDPECTFIIRRIVLEVGKGGWSRKLWANKCQIS